MSRPTTNQTQMLKRTLVAQRRALLRAAHDQLTHWSEHPIGEIAGDVPDSGDNSVAMLATDLDHSMLQRHVGAIRDIDAALVRMRNRRYAMCIDCGDDIGFERLAAFPTAKRCVACQRRHEGTFADEAGVTL